MPEPEHSDPVTRPFWDRLRQFTDARVALGRAGTGLPTAAHLEFQLAHARARDAVYSTLDLSTLTAGLTERNLSPILLQSAATDRRDYLLRPDHGRQLAPDSYESLAPYHGEWDVAFVIADGLSATAINQHALPLLDAILPALTQGGWQIGPVGIVTQGRVAVGDAIAHTLGARMVAILIGERPGLSAPDSLGVYLTWNPQPGITTDAERNCLSNIRTAGLTYPVAAARLFYLMTEARRRQLTGVDLKEETDLTALPESVTICAVSS